MSLQGRRVQHVLCSPRPDMSRCFFSSRGQPILPNITLLFCILFSLLQLSAKAVTSKFKKCSTLTVTDTLNSDPTHVARQFTSNPQPSESLDLISRWSFAYLFAVVGAIDLLVTCHILPFFDVEGTGCAGVAFSVASRVPFDALPGDEVHASTSAPFGRGGAKGLEFRLSRSVSRVEPKVIRGSQRCHKPAARATYARSCATSYAIIYAKC